MEHIRLVDILRSVVILGIALDVIVWALIDMVRFLEQRRWQGSGPQAGLWAWRWSLLALGLVAGSLAITLIALNAPLGWMAGLVAAFGAVQAGAFAVEGGRDPASAK